MSTVFQPKLQDDQRKQSIYMNNKAEKIIVKLDIQLDYDTKNHKNIRNVLQVVFWSASPSWNTRFDETFPTKASSLPYGGISVMACQYKLIWPLIPPPPLTSQKKILILLHRFVHRKKHITIKRKIEITLCHYYRTGEIGVFGMDSNILVVKYSTHS